MKRMFLMLTLVGGMSSVGLQAGSSGQINVSGMPFSGMQRDPEWQRQQEFKRGLVMSGRQEASPQSIRPHHFAIAGQK